MVMIERSIATAPSALLTSPSHAELQQVVNEWDRPSAVLDRDGTCLVANAAYATGTGKGATALHRAPLADLVHPRDLPHARELLARVLQDKHVHNAKLRILHASGHYVIWFWVATHHAETDTIVIRVADRPQETHTRGR